MDNERIPKKFHRVELKRRKNTWKLQCKKWFNDSNIVKENFLTDKDMKI